MSNRDQPKPTTKFGSTQDQFATIGGSKKTTLPNPEERIEIEVKTSKLKEVKNTHEEEKGQQTIRLPLSLRKWLRMQAPIEDRDISDVVTDALLAYKEKLDEQ